MKYVRQFAVDIEDNYETKEEEIVEALEAAGIVVLSCGWRATWTEEDYHKSGTPISSD